MTTSDATLIAFLVAFAAQTISFQMFEKSDASWTKVFCVSVLIGFTTGILIVLLLSLYMA